MTTTWKSRRPEFERDQLDKIHPAFVELAEQSIVYGSALTGAPGQPADLRDGQWKTVDLTDTHSIIGTADPSARSVEDSISHLHGGPITLNSPIGGSFSVRLTRLGGQRILHEVFQRLRGRG